MSVPKSLKYRVLLKTNGLCYYCKTKLSIRKKSHRNPVTIDHYIPLSKGGFDDYDNKVPACRKCNNEKGDLMPEEFFKKLNGQ